MTTAKSSEIVQAIVDLFNVSATKKAIGLKQIYYGEQSLIPEVPTLTVEAGDKRRELRSTGMDTLVEIPVYLVIFHSRLADYQDVLVEADTLTEAIEDELHKAANITLGGLIIHGFVSSVEPGYSSRGATVFVSHRLTFTVTTREYIGQ